MAKSLRSKSQRKSRAILHSKVFKPVEDARTARLSAKLMAIPASQQVPEPMTVSNTNGDFMMVDPAAYKSKTKKLSIISQITSKKNLTKKQRRQAKNQPKDFNIYGVSEKEIRF